MKFENTEVWGFSHALRGMRNPKESWDRSDSYYCMSGDFDCPDCPIVDNCNLDLLDSNSGMIIGKNDMKLAQHLIIAGSEHRKFLRQIFVSVDITAPLYWWKEFDTYKVGTVANSTSTMHKLATTPITNDCFEIDDYETVKIVQYEDPDDYLANDEVWAYLIEHLENLRQKYLETKDKRYWKELIRVLPESWLQTRTVTMNYENIFSMIRHRIYHKLNEWSGKDNSELTNFISWARVLPYAKEFLFIDEGEWTP